MVLPRVSVIVPNYKEDEEGLARTIGSLAARQHGERLAVARTLGVLQVWDVATGEKLHTLRGHASVVQCMALAPDGRPFTPDSIGATLATRNLMDELRKVRRVADRDPGNVTEVLLVLDATTGQNGLAQARQFADAVDLTGVVLTKLDGSAKGGIAFAIETSLGIPIKLVGLGETIGDLVEFDPDEFVDALFS